MGRLAVSRCRPACTGRGKRQWSLAHRSSGLTSFETYRVRARLGPLGSQPVQARLRQAQRAAALRGHRAEARRAVQEHVRAAQHCAGPKLERPARARQEGLGFRAEGQQTAAQRRAGLSRSMSEQPGTAPGPNWNVLRARQEGVGLSSWQSAAWRRARQSRNMSGACHALSTFGPRRSVLLAWASWALP